MINIVEIDTSVNEGKTTPEGEEAKVLGGTNYFQKKPLDVLIIGSEINRVTDETKEQFEKKHFLEIQNSKYDIVIENLIQNVYHQSVMYTSNIYEGVDNEYMKALFKQKLNWYREKLLQILQEDFLKYEYSIYRFSDFYNQEIQKQYVQKYLYGKR